MILFDALFFHRMFSEHIVPYGEKKRSNVTRIFTSYHPYLGLQMVEAQ
jgi:hypothetical protein